MRKVLFEAMGVEGVYKAIGNERKVSGTKLVARNTFYACIIADRKASDVLQAVCKIAEAGCDLDKVFHFAVEAKPLPGAGLRGGMRLCVAMIVRQQQIKTESETAWQDMEL